MKVKTVQGLAEVRRFLEVTDGPTLEVAHSQTGKTFRLMRVELTYRWKASVQMWVIDTGYAVKLTGIVLKKDGSDGLSTHKRTAPMNFETDESPEWTWLRRIVDSLRPPQPPEFRELDLSIDVDGTVR